MSEHPHRVVARRLWDAIAAADVEELQSVIAPDAVWIMPGRSPLAGRHQGVDAILGFMALCGELADELESELLEFFLGESGAILRYSIRATRRERVLEAEHLFVIRIEGTHIVEGLFVPVDLASYDLFWSDELDPRDTVAGIRDSGGRTKPRVPALGLPTP